MTETRAAALRWFGARVGQELETVQRRPDGMTWEPGARTLTREGNIFRLDGSRVEVTGNHVVHDVTGDRLTIEWLDSDGVQIHYTTYRDIPDAEDESDEWGEPDMEAAYADAEVYVTERLAELDRSGDVPTHSTP